MRVRCPNCGILPMPDKIKQFPDLKEFIDAVQMVLDKQGARCEKCKARVTVEAGT